MVVSSAAVPLPAAAQQESVRLVVAFRPGVAPAAADRAVQASGGRVVGRIPELGVRVVEVPAVAAARARRGLAADGQVASVEADGVVTADFVPTDPLWGYQWEQRQVRAPRAWDLNRGRYDTVVAVVDTGVQANHPDLAGHVLDGRDFVNGDRNAADDNGHGTAVAGVVGALTANGFGVAGGCPRCRILPVKALAANGTGYWSVAAQGIVWAANQGADVINLSFGGPTGGTTLYNAIAYARSKGAVVIASAGNNASTSLFYPGAFDNVISVAATTDMDLRYSWSNYSSSWVTLAAPGCTYTTILWSAYHSFCGTSAAAPVVSSIAALVESAPGPISGSEVEAILRRSTIPTPYAITRLGRIDAYEAVHRATYGTAPPNRQLKPSLPLMAGSWVTLAAGHRIGYRFDRHGGILRTRLVPLAASITVATDKRQTIPWRAGYWFRVTTGDLTGYWVQESASVFLSRVDEVLPRWPRLNPALGVHLGDGRHRGIRVDRDGDVLAVKEVTPAATSARTVKVARLPGRSGVWVYLIEGTLSGYWVRTSGDVVLESDDPPAASSTSALQPASPHFAPAQRVRFTSGSHVGYRFATDGSMLSSRALWLDHRVRFDTVKRMRVPGRDGWWLHIVDGPLAGHWVRDNLAHYLVP
ncbi:MAG TPA: S8 family serine peptidase [Candidatus Limnocylindria bacterium]|nr:S8 family serine peptidase [Candidatus Limnocylindria bacterium]